MAVVASAIGKALVTGSLRRIPKNPRHRDIVLALLCVGMRRRYPYSEIEINRYLRGALGQMEAVVDHVTCRRFLVDLGFLRRDRAGARYFLNPARLESTLKVEAVHCASELIEQALEKRR
ncbi:MAG: DUF2087 domain-containing protein [Pseudomonadales bacterium]